MTLEILFLFALLAVMVALFLTEKLPVDVTAFAGLSILVGSGLLRPEEAFLGFASPAVITMLSVFLVSAGLQYTGVAESLGNRIHRLVGDREFLLIVLVMVVVGGLSAFMNNIAATAVLMPAVVSLARKAGLPPSRLLMPLAFGAILGGTTTLVGTPPNLLTAQVLLANDLEPFALFAFAPFGLILLAVGVLYMVTLGRRLLPDAGAGMAEAERANLSQVYSIESSLFSITVPATSSLVGRTLAESGLASLLAVQVVSILRGRKENLAPTGEDVLRAGDHLVVQGRRRELQARLALRGLECEDLGALTVADDLGSVTGLLIGLGEGSPFAGRSLRELDLRNRYRLTVAAMWREDRPVLEGLGGLPLAAGDRLLLLGPQAEIQEMAARADMEVLAEGKEAIERLEQHLFMLQVPPGSALEGVTVAASRIRERLDLTVVGVVRGGITELLVSPNDPLLAGDRLLVAGPPGRIVQLLELGGVEVAERTPSRSLETRDVGLLEAVVAPRSAAVGRSLRDLAFRKRYGLRALAIWRGGEPTRTDLPDLPLRLGDGLLLHGPRDRIALLRRDPDFVVLSAGEGTPHRTGKAPIAIGALLAMVVLVVTGVFPIQVAAFMAATLIVLTRALEMTEAYKSIEWRAIFLVAAILPVGIAMERTGAAQLLANTVAEVAGGAGPHAVLLALMVLSSLLSQGLDGAPTVVLLGPVVVSTAGKLGLSPYPLMMGVGLAASAAFMTPFSHKANLLVMGAGGYRSRDFLKVGAPLTLVVFAVLLFLIPRLLPF